MATKTPIDQQRCPECGQLNHCQALTDPSQCWCMAKPASAPIPPGPALAACLCPGCFNKRYSDSDKEAKT